MEQTQQTQQTEKVTPPVQPTPQAQDKQKPGYLKRLFSGRLNRQNYIVGSTFFALLPLACFMVVIFNILLSPDAFAEPYLDPNNPTQIVTPQISIPSLLLTPANEYWTAAGILLFVISIPYLFSIQIRRLHDLDLNGWLWIVNFVPFISLAAFSPGINIFNPPLWLNIVNIVSLIFSIFPMYVSLWPGTKGINTYGDQPLARSNFLDDILQLR